MDELEQRVAGALEGTYRVERLLGQGGTAAVYLAQDLRHDRRVAVKVLFPQLAFSVGPERFLHEIRLAARLNHPHIVPLFDSGQADGLLYYVMPAVEGESLRARLERDIQLPVDEALRTTAQVGDALSYAHAAGVVHRDIKPENVMLSGGHAVVTDFGLAKALRAPAGASMTRMGMAVGTPAYMSPEQITGEPVDARTDLYALALVLYEMLAGRTPFPPAVGPALFKRVVENPPLVSDYRPEVPEAVTAALTRALAAIPAERFDSVAEFLAAIPMSVLSGSPYPEAMRRSSSLPTAVESPSVAVLPFTSMSHDPEDQYFGDGVAEEILNALAHVQGLRVAARTSSFALRNAGLDLREVGRRLGARNVLEGSVRRSGSRLRITAQLISTADGYHLWSERYDREARDIFAIQDEITVAVVDALKVTLLGEVLPPSVTCCMPDDDSECYDLCLRGQHFLNLAPEGLPKAFEYFTRATERNPQAGRAWAGLGWCHILTIVQGMAPPVEAIPKAREAAERALANGATALGIATMGYIAWLYDWNQPEAEQLLRDAVDLEPANALLRSSLALFVATRGAFDEAERIASTAAADDPLHPRVQFYLAWVHYIARRYEDAVKTCRRLLEIEPRMSTARWLLAKSLCLLGRMEEARTELAACAEESKVWFAPQAAVLIATGAPDEAHARAHELAQRAEREWVPPVAVAEVFAQCGLGDLAFEWLERSLVARDYWLVGLLVEPMFDPLRADPRFDEIVRRVGFTTPVSSPA
jgi:serine/threonine-protein kinase